MRDFTNEDLILICDSVDHSVTNSCLQHPNLKVEVAKEIDY